MTLGHNHIVDTKLEPGLYDQDYLILYASMAILESYIDEMGGVEAIEQSIAGLKEERARDGATLDEQIRVEECVLEIWQWWTGKHQEDKKQIEEARNSSGTWFEKQEAMTADEQKYLHMLIDIRPSLWV